MRKNLFSLFVIIILFFSSFESSYAIPKEGAKCNNLGQLSKKLTCISINGKKFWYEITLAKGQKKYARINTDCFRENMLTKGYNEKNVLVELVCKYETAVKGIEPAKWTLNNTSVSSEPISRRDYTATENTDNGYLDNFNSGPCELDPFPPSQWVAMQNFTINLQRCGGQIRLAKYALGNSKSKIVFQSANQFDDVQPCKLSVGNKYSLMHRNDNWSSIRKHPGPNSTIQLIPIYSEDSSLPKNSPRLDYEKYLAFIKDWVDYSTDFGSDLKYKIPNEYIKFPYKIADYKLTHPVNWDTPGHVKFNKDVISAVDSVIDFSKVDMAVVVAPPGTDASVMQQAAIGSFNTAEGLVPVGMTQFADIPSNPNGSIYSGLTSPFWWIHEAYHAGYGLDDHYGDTKWDVKTEHGMGWWTMMTPWGGDLSIWEKWLLGFVKDSQIQCKSDSSESIHWIAPSSVRTKESKAVVVSISNTKVVVLESIRAAGLHYKVPRDSQGVLVYEIDTTKSDHGMGMKLSLPTSRSVTNEPKPFFLAAASLKNGESTFSNGYVFTILDSGTFGEIIKISKA